MNGRVITGEIEPPRLYAAGAYSGIRTRRIFAFLLDYLIVGVLLVPVGIVVFVLGLLTLGWAWSLFTVIVPIVALTYVFFTLGGANQATTGMRAMGVRLERLDGRRIDGLTAVAHTVLFWLGNTVLTPLILLVTLFSDRKRTLHDLLLGTEAVRDER